MINYQQLARRVIFVATLFSLIVIALGAYTRLVHAGLGCPDWPLCYGHLWAPSSDGDVNHANLKFPETPVDLAKTWPEMTHRYLATSLGLLCIGILILGVLARRSQQYFPLRHSGLLLVFVILQGLFGMWTVTLKLWPQVVTLHLLGGFTTFCLLLLLYLRVQPPSIKIFTPSHSLIRVAVLSLSFVAIQVTLGGWVTSNYAALACPELPWCDLENVTTRQVLSGVNVLQEIGPNYLGGQLDGGARIAIHAMHRVGAVVVVAMLSLLIWLLLKQRQYLFVLAVSIVLTGQLLLGLANVYFQLPLYNAVAHNVVGALLAGTLVWLNWHLFTQRKLVMSS